MEIDGIKLRSCPFCGSDDLVRLRDTTDMVSRCANVCCNACYASGPTMYEDGGYLYRMNGNLKGRDVNLDRQLRELSVVRANREGF